MQTAKNTFGLIFYVKKADKKNDCPIYARITILYPREEPYFIEASFNKKSSFRREETSSSVLSPSLTKPPFPLW